MAGCEICNQIKKKKDLLFEDDKAVAFLASKPSSIGHIQIAPKKHYPIIEQVPDFEIGHMFFIANKLSVAVFETLGMQGTNILVQNGLAAGQKHAHFIINVIPRRQEDGLNFDWKPKHLGEEEMSTVELKLKEAAKNIGQFETEKAEPVSLDRESEKIPSNSSDDEENYLIKQLRRIP